jgi:crotonobetainyl-CoA:carnitine CoA-transferase CaiB-like acyl-CoA transferase
MSSAAVAVRRAAPRLGEQTDEILAGLGVAPGDISALRRDRVI